MLAGAFTMMKVFNKPFLSSHGDFWVWVLLCVLIGGIALIFLAIGIKASGGDTLIMPLDDTYIHFQYARQMASGELYVYNPGDKPTSGATSFLYSPLLALGYLLGFHSLQLGYWAVGLGALFHLLSAGLIYRMVQGFHLANERSATRSIAVMLAVAYLLAGPFVWAAFSGMETLLMTVCALASLEAYSRQQEGRSIALAFISALARPEGAVIAASLSVALFIKRRRLLGWNWLPIAAIGVQPFVNFLVTGSASASGNQAKSYLYNSTMPFEDRVQALFETWAQIWAEWLLGRNAVDGVYLPTVLFAMAMVGGVFSLWQGWQKRSITPGMLALVWLVLMSAGIASLETAFWHFKRYQLPLMALFFPLAGWALLRLHGRWGRVASVMIVGTILLGTLWTLPEYARRYADNIRVVHGQQVAMAYWVDANLPPDARIGVHDVGVMRYVGQRATYDLVGLTTEDVAMAWRQGSGTIYDTMQNHPYRPDYFAIYHDIQSLPLLEQAGVFGEELARFSIPLPENTVASATSTQIVSRAQWPEEASPQANIMWLLPEGAQLLDTLDIANLEDEARFNFAWDNRTTQGGFASIVRQLPVAGCNEDGGCLWRNGLRVLSGETHFVLPNNANAMLLRVHASTVAEISACEDAANGVIVPEISGDWVDILFYPATDCIETPTRYYLAYMWFYQVPAPDAWRPPSDAVELRAHPAAAPVYLTAAYQLEAGQVVVDAEWWASEGVMSNGKVFVHLYADINAPPVQQADIYVGGMLPPANWWPGQSIAERYILTLDGLPTGTYQLAIGMYDPTSETRYTVRTADEELDRLFLGDIEVINEN